MPLAFQHRCRHFCRQFPRLIIQCFSLKILLWYYWTLAKVSQIRRSKYMWISFYSALIYCWSVWTIWSSYEAQYGFQATVGWFGALPSCLCLRRTALMRSGYRQPAIVLGREILIQVGGHHFIRDILVLWGIKVSNQTVLFLVESE